MLYIKRYFLIIIVIIIILLNIIPTPYYLIAPGEAINLSQSIIVENGEKDARGKFLLTSTILLPANLSSSIRLDNKYLVAFSRFNDLSIINTP